MVTGVGSRKTSPENLKKCEAIGRHILRLKKYAILRSGHADGADYAFEMGAKECSVLYLPFDGYNKKLPFMTKNIIVLPDPPLPEAPRTDYTCKVYDSVDQFHPNPAAVLPSARSYLARNYLQLFGISNLPTDIVVCCAPLCSRKSGTPNRLEGGTGQTVAIAEHFNIPVYNLFYEHVDDVHQAIDTFYLDHIVPLHL